MRKTIKQLERARDEELYNTAVVTSTSNVWTPTPWEMIEVSNDGKRWKTEEFVEAEPRLLGWSIYLTKVGWTYTYSQYARPLSQEISNEWAKEAGRDFAKKHLSQPIEKLNTEWRNIEIQIHAITSTLNTLIERINNK